MLNLTYCLSLLDHETCVVPCGFIVGSGSGHSQRKTCSCGSPDQSHPTKTCSPRCIAFNVVPRTRIPHHKCTPTLSAWHLHIASSNKVCQQCLQNKESNAVPSLSCIGASCIPHLLLANRIKATQSIIVIQQQYGFGIIFFFFYTHRDRRYGKHDEYEHHDDLQQ